jgi:deoxyribodipyrimidine photo-lyase
MSTIPGRDLRRVVVREGAPRSGADYVLYWMQASRRARNNVALDEAIREANALRLPVLVYEALRPDYPEANARVHTFVVEGLAANARDAASRGLGYVASVPSARDVDRTALARLSRRAAIVVTDDAPAFIFRGQTHALARRIDCPLIAVDGCGVVPLREMTKREYAAATIRPKIHRLLPTYLRDHDEAEVGRAADGLEVDLDACDVASSPSEIVRLAGVDATVPPSPLYRGGRDAALDRLHGFVGDLLDGYAERRRDAGIEGTSRLSPYLHFGHVGALEVALAVADAPAPRRDREAFLEELIVRRELAYNFCHFEPRHTSVEALPDWAKRTLTAHAFEERPDVPESDVEAGTTYDDVWNLAQRELLATGLVTNQARMLWGKKLLEWSRTPQAAVDTMIRLHHRYALDGRNPATYANILWILGLHDRAWGPERPIFGTVRYMSSDAFKRKHDVKAYRRFVEAAERDRDAAGD